MRSLPEVMLLLLLAACSDGADAASPPIEPELATSSSGVAEPEERDAVATVSEVHGDVRIRRIEAVTWVPLASGQALHAGDSIQTMEGASAMVRFSDTEAETRLEPSTTLQLPAAAPRVVRLNHVSGRLSVGLRSGGATDRVEVRLPPGTLVIRADQNTGDAEEVEARVEVDGEHTQVAMLHGRADLERDGGTAFAIEEERFVSVAPDGVLVESGWTGPPVALRDPADGATVRTRGSVRFRWQPTEAADHYQVEISASESGQLGAIKTVAASTAEVELSSGTYRWAIRGLRDDEPQHDRMERVLHVELDRTAPALEVSSPRHGMEVRAETLVVRGSTEPGASVTVDGAAATVSPDGAFTQRLRVPPGLANVVIRATDDLGNSRIVSRSVVRR